MCCICALCIQVTKSRDISTRQRSLTFEVDYPEAAEGSQPRHRLMSAYEQRVDVPPDRNYQYLLLACDPYETVAFKIPNQVSSGTTITYTHMLPIVY